MSGLQSALLGSPGGTMKYQEFLASGTFTPSAALLAKGGVCYVQAIGGGGSGAVNRVNTDPVGAGSGGQWVEGLVTVSGAVTVTIGAGGAAATSSSSLVAGNPGGTTSFGSLLTALGGLGGITTNPICGDGSLSKASAYYSGSAVTWIPGRGINGKGGGGSANSLAPAVDGGTNFVSVSGTAPSAAANSGAGTGSVSAGAGTVTSGQGGTGWLRVIWWE